MTTSPWDDPRVAALQRELVDRQLAGERWPTHFQAFVDAVRATKCPGSIWEVGCASGYGRELLDRAGVSYASYSGIDISRPAIEIARERYPESDWTRASLQEVWEAGGARHDVVIDGCALMHVEDWRTHLRDLCAASRRWLVLHRLPVNGKSAGRFQTEGYGKVFPAWRFHAAEIAEELSKHGFVPCGSWVADDGAATLLYARPRVFATYFDRAYWAKASAMWTSLRQRARGPVELHALCWDASAASLAEHAGMIVTTDIVSRHGELALTALPGPSREPIEHMWTCGPQHIVDVMVATGQPVTYVDADILFHGSPEPLFAEAAGGGFVIAHGFADAARGLPGPTVESHSIFGTFNVGLVHFADQELARWWAARCRDWCYDRPSGDGRYGDQAYLDRLARQPGVRVIEHPGACLGPWAVHTRALDVRDGVIHFGGRPLVAYHYSSYQTTPHGGEQIALPDYALTPRQIEILYTPYREALKPK